MLLYKTKGRERAGTCGTACGSMGEAYQLGGPGHILLHGLPEGAAHAAGHQAEDTTSVVLLVR